ncbi:DUF2330 domain-containing protein [Naumannella huperziae]
MARRHRPLLLLVTLLLAIMGGVVAAPAYACACGAYEPSRQRDLSLSGEQAAISFDGSRERMAISTGLRTDSTDLAVLLPLPAEATLTLADPAMFDQLYDATAPEVITTENWLPGGAGVGDGAPGAAGGSVQVLAEERIGEYATAQLRGTPDDVAQWLGANGFRSRDEVLDGLGGYLERGWIVLAVRASLPGGGADELRNLQPLVAEFATSEPVYPMLLSATSEDRLPFRLYAFAPHRLDATVGAASLPVSFAGPFDAGAAPAAAAFAQPGAGFLTRFDDVLDPREITSDVAFADSAVGDQPLRGVIHRTVDRSGWTLAGGAAILIIAAIAVAVGVGLRRRRAAG